MLLWLFRLVPETPLPENNEDLCSKKKEEKRGKGVRPEAPEVRRGLKGPPREAVGDVRRRHSPSWVSETIAPAGCPPGMGPKSGLRFPSGQIFDTKHFQIKFPIQWATLEMVFWSVPTRYELSCQVLFIALLARGAKVTDELRSTSDATHSQQRMLNNLNTKN